MDTATTRHLQRGAGVLVAEVSTNAATDEIYWKSVEKRNGCGLSVRASFGPGSPETSVPWTAPHHESTNHCRSATVRLPYFNLADGVESTEAALVIEIIVCRPLRGAQPGNASNGPDNKGASWSAENRKTSFGNSGHGKMMGYPSRLVAMGTLDVQTALSSCSGSGSEESGVCLSLGKIEVPGLESNGLRSKVILTFSSEAALAERVGGMQQHAEEDEVLPASFVVATTLFDCATEMKEAELRLYVRCGGTERDRPLLCSARRGAIAVHDSFEWNVCADVSLLFPNGLPPCARRQSGTLIVALCENNSSVLPNDGRSTTFDPHEIAGAIAVSEVSCQDLISCGPAGRWCPLRAPYILKSERVCKGGDCQTGRRPGDIVGEVLIAFAVFQWPVAAALPRTATERERRVKMERRVQPTQRRAAAMQDGAEGTTKEGKADGIGAKIVFADKVIPDLQRPLAEDNSSKASTRKFLMYLHVWDALVPFCQPESALYFSVRARRRGSRGQRVSTKATRGRGGPRARSQTPATGSYEATPSGVYDRVSAGDGACSMHFVWDEHVSLSVDGGFDVGVLEDTLIELRLVDACVSQHGTSAPAVAAREGEPVVTFGGRDWRSRGLEDTSTKRVTPPRIPDPVVYELPLHSHGAVLETDIGGGAEAAKVRMAVLVLTLDEPTVACADQVRAFLQRKADVARIPGGLKRQPSSRTLDVGATSLTSIIPAQTSSTGLRLLDLSTAVGLFNRFADDVSRHDDETRVVSRPQRDAAIDDKEQWKRQVSSKREGATISQEKLVIVAREYFPGLPDLGYNSEQSTLRRTNDYSIATQGDDRGSLSFADFTSWLRKIPEEELGAAGLLVTPRTALDKTETIMGESTAQARELATTLKLDRVPARGLFGDWCTKSLRSTGEDVALDRVRLGWGEGGRGETAESSWRRHTRLLRRDVKVLDRAMAALELRSDDAQEMGGSEENVADGSSVEERQVEEGNTAEGIQLDPIVSEAMIVKDPCGDKAEMESAGSGGDAVNHRRRALENQGSGVDSLVALHLRREAATLGVAAEHLKEALRCASDAMRSKIENPLPRVNTSRHLHESASTSRVDDAYNGRSKNGCHTNEPGGRRCSLLADKKALGANDRRQCHQYGVLLRQIKQVRRLQVGITALQRRAAAAAMLPKQMGEKRSRSRVDWRLGGDGSNRRGDDDGAGAPRSALALVKRIRLAREVARPPVEATPYCDEVGTIPPQNRHRSHSLTSSVVLQDNDESLTAEAETAMCAATGRSERGSRQQSPRESCCFVKDMEEGTVARSTCRPLRVEAKTPFLEMLRRPSSLARVRNRLAGIQAAFDESGIDLPPAIASATAERVIEVACGGGERQECEGVSVRSPPAVALCCPIDRFALHVFRTAGAAEDGGRAVFCDVQELAGTDGLDTYASGNSLWVVAAKAGVVDVERWVVAAVLWQTVDVLEVSAESSGDHRGTRALDRSTKLGRGELMEIEEAVRGDSRMGNDKDDAGCFVCDPSRSTLEGKGEGGVVIGAVGGTVEAAAGVDEEMATAAATSLWEELRREAFTLVLGRHTAEEDTPSGGHPPVSRGGSERGQYAERVFPSEVATTNGGRFETHNSSADLRPLHKYDSKIPGPCSFDLALVRTLAQARRLVRSTAETSVSSATIETTAQICVEEALLYMYATAGFTQGSGLGVADLVEAVKIRRERISARRGARCSCCRVTGGRSSNDRCTLKSLGVEDTASNGQASFDSGGVEQATTTAAVERVAEKPMGTERKLAGIPTELLELFRTAAFAEDIRRRQVPQQGTREANAAEAAAELAAAAEAEAAIIRVLDSNRTLESAAFCGGKTALHHAAARGDAFLVRLLLERGCKPHLKDFAGKRACDLTRNLKCLCLLDALKKAQTPIALCLPTVAAPREGEESIAQTTARAMTSVNFAVSFCGGQKSAENVVECVAGVRKSAAFCGDKVKGERGRGTGVAWRDGVARWFDLRNKVLYVEHNSEEEGSDKTGNDEASIPPPPILAVVGREGEDGAAGDNTVPAIGRRFHPRSILDVRLTCCLSPRGGELFNQLRVFSCEWKDRLARDVLDVAIDAAAELGALFRFVVLGDFTRDMVTEVAREAHNDEQFIAADAAAALAESHAAALTARDAASTHAKELTGEDNVPQSTGVKDTTEKHHSERRLRFSIAGAVPGESAALLRQAAGKNTAAMLNFRCTVIITAEEMAAGHDVAGEGGKQAELGSTGTPRREKRSVRRYLGRLTVKGGVCTVVIRGRSYLRASTNGKGVGNTPVAIDLEGGDAGIRRVLDNHAVSLSACLQTFDVMQDMEDPDVVLGMLAAGTCQLSTRFIEEGIEFLSLNQSDQEALKDDVLGELYHATRHSADALVEWEELTVTMRAYCGVTCVSLVGSRSSGEEKQRDETVERIEVSPPTGSGWLRPEAAAAALVAQGTTTSSRSSSSSTSLPQSAVTLVTSLMGCNPCEVLGSLQRGHGTDGRLALIGLAHNGDLTGSSLIGDDGGGGAFRCSLEVAWDRDAGGVFVRRFGMQADETRPRYTIRAVGIRNFSIAQLPVTLEDIDAVWDQLDDTESVALSGDASSDPGTAASPTATNSNGCLPFSSQDSGSAAPSQSSRNGQDNILSKSLHEVAEAGLPSETARVPLGEPAHENRAINVENVSPTQHKARNASAEGERGQTECVQSVAIEKQETPETGLSEPARLPSAHTEEDARGCSVEVSTNRSLSASSGVEKIVQGTRGGALADAGLQEEIGNRSICDSGGADCRSGGVASSSTLIPSFAQQHAIGNAGASLDGRGNVMAAVDLHQGHGDDSRRAMGLEAPQPRSDFPPADGVVKTIASSAPLGGKGAPEFEFCSDLRGDVESGANSSGTENGGGCDGGQEGEERLESHPEYGRKEEARPGGAINSVVRYNSPVDNAESPAAVARGDARDHAAGVGVTDDDIYDTSMDDKRPLSEVHKDSETSSEQQLLQPALSLPGKGDGNTVRGLLRKGGDTTETKLDTTTPAPHASVIEAVNKEVSGLTNATSAFLNVWAFPPSFIAEVVLSTAVGSVECVVEGEISLLSRQTTEVGGTAAADVRSAAIADENVRDNAAASIPLTTGSADNVASWKSVFCNYVIPGEGSMPMAKIDLEDDEAQARLEDLITGAYGLTIDEVIEQFSPETDLGSMDSVVQSFTNSICHLRPNGQEQCGGAYIAGAVRNDDIYEAVARALRGPFEWTTTQVRVHASRVVGVTVFLTPTERVATKNIISNSAGVGALSAAPNSSAVATVDCSGVTLPSKLKAHLLAGGVPDSAVQIMERAGFCAGGAAIDISDVFATLAEEAKTRGLRSRPWSEEDTQPGDALPRVYPGSNQSITLRPRAQTENAQDIVVAVTGTQEDLRLDIKPVAGDGDATTDGTMVLCARVSGLRARGDPPCSALDRLLLSTDAAPTKEDPGPGDTSCPHNASARDDTISRFSGAKMTDAKQDAEDSAPLNRNGELMAGARVEARFGGRSDWFPGVVRAIVDSRGKKGGRSSNLPTVAVDYDDGDTEENVPRVRVRLPGQKQPRLLHEGDEVDVKRGKRIALALVVSRASSKEGRYDLRLMDRGEKLVENVPRSAIMALHGWPPGDAKSVS